MKKMIVVRYAMIVFALAGVSGCQTTSSEGPPSGAKSPAANFNAPIEKTRQAAVNALTTVGCKIKKEESNYVEGYRPPKMGLLVGSGNETIKVWLTSEGPAQTSVTVKTVKSVLGIAGQKNWDDEVLAEMRRSL